MVAGQGSKSSGRGGSSGSKDYAGNSEWGRICVERTLSVVFVKRELTPSLWLRMLAGLQLLGYTLNFGPNSERVS